MSLCFLNNVPAIIVVLKQPNILYLLSRTVLLTAAYTEKPVNTSSVLLAALALNLSYWVGFNSAANPELTHWIYALTSCTRLLGCEHKAKVNFGALLDILLSAHVTWSNGDVFRKTPIYLSLHKRAAKE